MTVLLLFPTNQNNLERWCTAAQSLGVDLAVVEYTGRPLCYPARVGPVLNLGNNTDDITDLLPVLDGIDLTGVVAYSEPAVLLAHRLAVSLGLPHNNRLLPESVRQKAIMRDLLRSAGLPQPRTILTTREAISASDLHDVRFPLVVKPDDGVGSFGVTMAHTPEQAVDAVTAILRAEPFAAIGWSIGNSVTIEEFVEGSDYSCEVVVLGGKLEWAGITAHCKNSGPDFDYTGAWFPGRTKAPAAAIYEMAQRAVAGLGIDDGVCHIEFREAADGPVIIEIANRVPAGGIPQIVEWASGVRLEESALSIAAGRGHVARRGAGRCRYAGTRLHFAAKPAIRFPEDAALVESVVRADLGQADNSRPTQITELVGMSIVCGDNLLSIAQWAQESASE